ncbi:LHFPL tetraspan subfamily member 2a protein-like [Montipora capricornis]|uniref:LHFPL tetraspan subfamily member 2a protein-like n=1 Tax=Montipora foliosa TaxID=591990 RepID=UPI0035F1EFB6
MSAISVLWTLLSVILLFTGSLAIFSPFWYEHLPDPKSANRSESFVAFGPLRFCFQDQFVTLQEINEFQDSKYCSFYEGIFPGIPSIFWKVAAIIYAVALMLQLVALVLAHVFCCRKFVFGKSVTSVAAIIQSTSVVLLLVSFVIFWSGLKSLFVRQHCGSSSSYFNAGTCQIAWGSVLAIVSTGLLIFCPMIAYYLSVTTPRSKATVV